MGDIHKIVTVPTEPFDNQKPGTSGLRKKVTEFEKPKYTENFIQCIFDAGLGHKKKGASLVVGGDGRYYSPEVVQLIIQIAAANGIAKLYVGEKGFLSTPAVSCLIRKKEINEGVPLNGGIILTASHNPGGPDGDFGIKYNCENGGPAPDHVTKQMHEMSRQLKEYRICPSLDVDLGTQDTHTFQIEEHGTFTVKIIDSVADYAQLMQEIFDFDPIKKLLSGEATGKPFKVRIDCMHGAAGPYVQRILGEMLGANEADLQNTNPLPNFGGLHPDPNLTYADKLVAKMKEGEHDMGAAFDGDADRNMILGRSGFFVTPSDSLAILAANLDCIPYFQKTGVKGYARSMPTAGAVDRVAEQTGKEMHEVPTGWKYFGNLMDAGLLSLCGEESFGTGSDHIREKDGLWACLAWLQVLASKKKSIKELCVEHWKKYGRNVFTRYDYEHCHTESAEKMMNNIEKQLPAFIGQTHTSEGQKFKITKADNFEYTDPVDQSVATKQGLRIIFSDDSRIIYRLSGTGSTGATIRMYVDSFCDPKTLDDTLDAEEILKPLISLALTLSELEGYTGRTKPTVIT